MQQYGTVEFPIEFDGDFCGQCEYLLHTKSGEKDRFKCSVYHTKNDKPKALKTLIHDLDSPKGYVQRTSPEREPLRCTGCLQRNPSMGVNRIPPKGQILYPSPAQLLQGTPIPCRNIVDLAPHLNGWGISASYGEDDDGEVIVAHLVLKKGHREFHIGNTEELNLGGLLDKITPEAAGAIFRWAHTLQNEVIDVRDTIMWTEFIKENG